MEKPNHLKVVDCNVNDCLHWQPRNYCNCKGKLTISPKGVCVSFQQNTEFFKQETHRLHRPKKPK